MKTEPPLDDHFKNGLTVEHIMLSVTVVSAKNSSGQFDDSCCRILDRGLMEYMGVKSVRADVLYKHTKIENHSNTCECGDCRRQGD